MRIGSLKVNHLVNPLGYDLAHPTISYMVEEAEGTYQASARILVAKDRDFSRLIYDSGERGDIVSTGFELPLDLAPMTRYYWKVIVTDDAGDCGESEVQWFETAKTVTFEHLPRLETETEQGSAASDGSKDGGDCEAAASGSDRGGKVSGDCEAAASGGNPGSGDWQAKWITPALEKDVQAVVFRDIEVKKPVARARAYMVGLGLYEFCLDGEKQGSECLLPGFSNYDAWIQYQTYELELSEGAHRLEIVLGDGWYKGWFGLRQKSENYGDRLAAIAELRIWYADGTEEVIGTDESWRARRSRIVRSGIYPGEEYDAALDVSAIYPVEEIDLGYDRLSPRLSPPIEVRERLRPVRILHSPKGETILDMGQNMAGWICFRCDAPAGTRIHLQMGEILQDGCFYNANLRTAQAAFTYISDGKERWVRQHFTFYGFRYVKVEGWTGAISEEDFEGLVIHSELEPRGEIATSDPLVNRLVENARWGMKGNFIDVPTDCPQRDERYGWTGDAQIFSGTACYFADTYAFYRKYGRDVFTEQAKLGGSVPDVVPVCNYPGDASTAWADCATVIPWNVYLHSGDKGILRAQYASMRGWVDYMRREDDRDGGKRLWLTGAHYADWLALDGSFPGGVYGATDPGFIASAYYYYSARVTAKAARVLGYEADAADLGRLAEEIRAAFEREYFTPAGNLAVDTMTAYVVALEFGLAPEYAVERLRKGLLRRLKKNFYHLETGFVGTPFLCRALSENGMNDLAYHLLLEKGYPGWLYEVLMGATTIWERWNSVLPDGKISGTEMNSLNHYSYGSIVEWMFREMAGIRPREDGAGFKRFRLAPRPSWQIQRMSASLRSAAGRIESCWEIRGKKLYFRFLVPFDTRAELVLPDAGAAVIEAAVRETAAKETSVRETAAKEASARACGGSSGAPQVQVRQEGTDVVLNAGPGVYEFLYEPTTPYRKVYSLDSPWEELQANPQTRAILEREYKTKEGKIPFEKELCTLEELTWSPFTCLPQEERERLDQLLRAVEPAGESAIF